MSKAVKFINEHIRNCFNYNSYAQDPIPWLTPNDARKAVEIAREEVIEKAQDWIADTFKYDGSNDFNCGLNDAMSMLLDDFTEYIKQAMKDGTTSR